MLRKLIGFEFRSTCRLTLPALGVLWITSMVMLGIGLLARAIGDQSVVSFGLLSGLIYYFVLLVFPGSILILGVVQFYRNLVGKEAYLMLALPAYASDHVIAKLVTWTVWLIFALVNIVVSVVVVLWGILGSREWSNIDWTMVWAGVRASLNQYTMFSSQVVPLACALLVLALCSVFLMPYLAIALGQLSTKNHVLMSVVAYIGIYLTVTCVNAIWATPLLVTAVVGAQANQLVAYLGASLLAQMIYAVIYFAGTVYLFTKKVNLI